MNGGRREPGFIYDDGSIQSRNPETRYVAGRVWILKSELDRAKRFGWRETGQTHLSETGYMALVERT